MEKQPDVGRQEDAVWRASHEHLAASARDGKLIVAHKSQHLIPYTEPEVIVAVIAEWM